MNSYRTPNAQWLGSPNFSLNRDGHTMTIPPAYIVMHTMVGTVAGANTRFQQAGQQASAHYGVGLDGRLVQWVDEKDAAWHAGNYQVNLDSIGIEHEDGGKYNDPRPAALKQASARLVADICKRYAIPCNRSAIKLHKEVSLSPTACPDALEVDEIIGLAQAVLNPVRVPPAKPEWQQNLSAHAEVFQLSRAIPLLNMETGATVASIPAGPLSVAYATSVGGKAYWMALYSVNAGKPNGLLQSDVAAATAPSVPTDKLAQAKALAQQIVGL